MTRAYFGPARRVEAKCTCLLLIRVGLNFHISPLTLGMHSQMIEVSPPPAPPAYPETNGMRPIIMDVSSRESRSPARLSTR